MHAMTLAFVGLTLLALALIVVPRLQRARRPQRRPAIALAGAGASPVVASWARSSGSAAAPPADDLDDEWDDDLGWVEPAPRARAAEPDPAPAEPAVRDDAPPAPATAAPPADPPARRTDTVLPRADVIASPADADPDAPLELEDDDWRFEPPAVRGTTGPAPAYSSRPPAKRRRGPFGSPVFLLALYSCAGLALIVLAVNLLSGSLSGDGEPEPAVAPEPVATVQASAPAPDPEPTVSAAELDRRRDAAAAAIAAARGAVQRAERRAVAAERRRIARERRERAAARRRAERRRREAASATPPAATAPAAPAPTVAPAPVAPAPSGGGGGGGRSCEFCIG
jgi:hypothetical protein